MGDKKELVKKIVYKFVELSNVIDKSLIEKYIEKLCLLEVDDIIDSIMISLNDLFNRKVLTVEQILSNSDMIIALNPQKYHSADDLINRLEYFTKKDYISKNIKDINSNMNLKDFVIILFSIMLVIFLIMKIFGYDILNVIPTISDNITYGMLFVTGLLTSIHCISMCGAINLMATYNRENKINLKRPIIYNLGGLTSYTFLGELVG